VLMTDLFSTKPRWGVCRDPETCNEQGEIYWPRDGKCYPKLSRGPCPRGELLVVGEDGLATCSCSMSGDGWEMVVVATNTIPRGPARSQENCFCQVERAVAILDYLTITNQVECAIS